MTDAPATIPTPAAGREEPVGAGVPPTRAQRDALAARVAEFVARGSIVPPLSFTELAAHTEAFLRCGGVDRQYLPYAAVLLSNEAWRGDLAAVPYNRRLLLLPQCLRSRATCRAKTDEYGLLCAR